MEKSWNGKNKPKKLNLIIILRFFSSARTWPKIFYIWPYLPSFSFQEQFCYRRSWVSWLCSWGKKNHWYWSQKLKFHLSGSYTKCQIQGIAAHYLKLTVDYITLKRQMIVILSFILSCISVEWSGMPMWFSILSVEPKMH